jgi:PLP dependent protein
MSTILINLKAIRDRIATVCKTTGRELDSVQLLAVSKTFSAQAVQEALDAGQTHFGENYVDEALPKIHALQDRRGEMEWHFIGPLQSNKTAKVAQAFDWVHSVDRIKVAERLSAQRPEHLPPLQICVQVNISNEPSKSGVSLAALSDLVRAIWQLPRLRLRGLMAVPAPAATLDLQRLPHRALRLALDHLNETHLVLPALNTLSMGMSDDLEAAVLEGATIVRVGRAVFGARS